MKALRIFWSLLLNAQVRRTHFVGEGQQGCKNTKPQEYRNAKYGVHIYDNYWGVCKSREKQRELLIMLNRRVCLLSLIVGLVLLPGTAAAQDSQDPLSRVIADLHENSQEFLPVAEAFEFSLYEKEQTRSLEIAWRIAPEYYLYRDSLKVVGAKFSSPLPQGITHTDAYFGTTNIFRRQLLVAVAPEASPIHITWQGCADAGLCYPPHTAELAKQNDGRWHLLAISQGLPQGVLPALPAQQSLFANAWQGDIFVSGLWVILTFYLLAGVLTAFTPCVYPVIPLTVYALRDQPRPLVAALAYTLGLSMVYAALGGIVALLGGQFMAQLQSPPVLVVMISALVYLAGASYGVWSLDLTRFVARIFPQSISYTPAKSSLVYGAVSGLLLGPCAAPAWAGALLFIATNGNASLGLAALLCYGYRHGRTCGFRCDFGSTGKFARWCLVAANFAGNGAGADRSSSMGKPNACSRLPLLRFCGCCSPVA